MDEPPTDVGSTPQRIALPGVARARFERVAALCNDSSDDRVRIQPAYSFKTNPSELLVRLAREHGLRAEVISIDEWRWARECGFGSDAIIYNGPEPLAVDGHAEGVDIVFADSVEAFARNAAAHAARLPGIRLRPSMIASRFGVPVDDDELLATAVRASGSRELAVSMHVRREDCHAVSWLDVCIDVLSRAQRLAAQTATAIRVFDAGGGWEPDAFDTSFQSEAQQLHAAVARMLPDAREVLVEPGQAIATPTEALVARVVEVRHRPGRREAILDIGYNDWPQQHSYVHRLFVARAGRWVALTPGADRLGGKTCLEYDVLDGIAFPDDIAPGDLMLVADVGSYDSSMSFRFARAQRAIPKSSGSAA